MPKAIDVQRLTVTNDPTQRLDFNNGKLAIPPLDPSMFIDALVNAIKGLVGIDLSSPQAFLSSLIDVITTGGPAVDFIASLVDMIGSAIGIPNLGSTLQQLLPLVSGGGIIQQVVDAIVNGLTGGSTTGNDPGAIFLGLINQGLSIPLALFDQIFASLAVLTGQVTAVQNNPGGVSQTDDFLTASVAAYTNVQGTLAVANGVIQTAGLAAGYIGTTGTPRKPLTDKHGIQIEVAAKLRGVTRAWICGDATMSNYAALEVYSGFDGEAARIVTGASPSLTVVQKQVDFVGTARMSAAAFDVRYDPAANKFTVLRNNQSVLDWVDATNIVTHGSTKRLVGPVSNGLNDPDNRGFGIKKVTFYDW